MKPLLKLFIFVILIITSEAFAAEKITYSNYYTAPNGSYQTIRLIPRTAPSGSCLIGTIFANKDLHGGDIQFCLDNGNGVGTWGYVPGIWKKASSKLVLTPTLNDTTVGVGIGTATPDMKLTILGDGGIIAKGDPYPDPSATSLSTSGAGTRLIWYPKKSAARAGTVTGTQWDESNIGLYSTVGGGLDNKASGINSAILAGESNVTTNSFDFIGGGKSNTATGGNSTIIGGISNTVSGLNAFIGGGSHNISSGLNSAICGGGTNTASADYSTICGGNGANATGLNSTICGGDGATNFKASGESSTIAGGNDNQATGFGSFVGGGSRNLASGLNSTICGGGARGIMGSTNTDTTGGNIASGNFSVIGGGHKNTASGSYSVVLGGDTNIASGDYSVIPGGYNNIAAGDNSVAMGSNMQLTATADRTFVWGYSATPVTITAPDSFIIYSGKVGIGLVNPSEKLEVNGNMRIDGNLSITNPPLFVAQPTVGLEVTATGTVGLDLAEKFDTMETVEVGDVLVIDDSTDMKLKRSSSANDTKVAGIASGSPAIVFKDSQLELSPAAGSFLKGTEVPVALAGRVPCKVSNENGPIHIGDYLTTSSVPGHAMKANDNAPRGSIVGMALESFSAGPKGEPTSTIVVFTSLQ